MKYKGSCHCGQVRFEAAGEITGATACNCSICRRKGALMWFIARSALTLLTPEDNAGTYVFNRHAVRHRFCPACGIHPYGEGTAPDGSAMAAVNLRCIDAIDLDALAVAYHDGRST